MGSISSEIRAKQKEEAVTAFETRKSILAEAQVDEKAAARDPKLRALKADVRKASKRLAAIAARAAHVEKVKADKAATPKVSKDEGKKKGEGKKKAAAQPQGGGKKEKKK